MILTCKELKFLNMTAWKLFIVTTICITGVHNQLPEGTGKTGGEVHVPGSSVADPAIASQYSISVSSVISSQDTAGDRDTATPTLKTIDLENKTPTGEGEPSSQNVAVSNGMHTTILPQVLNRTSIGNAQYSVTQPADESLSTKPPDRVTAGPAYSSAATVVSIREDNSDATGEVDNEFISVSMLRTTDLFDDTSTLPAVATAESNEDHTVDDSTQGVTENRPLRTVSEITAKAITRDRLKTDSIAGATATEWANEDIVTTDSTLVDRRTTKTGPGDKITTVTEDALPTNYINGNILSTKSTSGDHLTSGSIPASRVTTVDPITGDKLGTESIAVDRLTRDTIMSTQKDEGKTSALTSAPRAVTDLADVTGESLEEGTGPIEGLSSIMYQRTTGSGSRREATGSSLPPEPVTMSSASTESDSDGSGKDFISTLFPKIEEVNITAKSFVTTLLPPEETEGPIVTALSTVDSDVVGTDDMKEEDTTTPIPVMSSTAGNNGFIQMDMSTQGVTGIDEDFFTNIRLTTTSTPFKQSSGDSDLGLQSTVFPVTDGDDDEPASGDDNDANLLTKLSNDLTTIEQESSGYTEGELPTTIMPTIYSITGSDVEVTETEDMSGDISGDGKLTATQRVYPYSSISTTSLAASSMSTADVYNTDISATDDSTDMSGDGEATRPVFPYISTVSTIDLSTSDISKTDMSTQDKSGDGEEPVTTAASSMHTTVKVTEVETTFEYSLSTEMSGEGGEAFSTKRATSSGDITVTQPIYPFTSLLSTTDMSATEMSTTDTPKTKMSTTEISSGEISGDEEVTGTQTLYPYTSTLAKTDLSTSFISGDGEGPDNTSATSFSTSAILTTRETSFKATSTVLPSTSSMEMSGEGEETETTNVYSMSGDGEERTTAMLPSEGTTEQGSGDVTQSTTVYPKVPSTDDMSGSGELGTSEAPEYLTTEEDHLSGEGLITFTTDVPAATTNSETHEYFTTEEESFSGEGLITFTTKESSFSSTQESPAPVTTEAESLSGDGLIPFTTKDPSMSTTKESTEYFTTEEGSLSGDGLIPFTTKDPSMSTTKESTEYFTTEEGSLSGDGLIPFTTKDPSMSTTKESTEYFTTEEGSLSGDGLIPFTTKDPSMSTTKESTEYFTTEEGSLSGDGLIPFTTKDPSIPTTKESTEYFTTEEGSLSGDGLIPFTTKDPSMSTTKESTEYFTTEEGSLSGDGLIPFTTKDPSMSTTKESTEYFTTEEGSLSGDGLIPFTTKDPSIPTTKESTEYLTTEEGSLSGDGLIPYTTKDPSIPTTKESTEYFTTEEDDISGEGFITLTSKLPTFLTTDEIYSGSGDPSTLFPRTSTALHTTTDIILTTSKTSVDKSSVAIEMNDTTTSEMIISTTNLYTTEELLTSAIRETPAYTSATATAATSEPFDMISEGNTTLASQILTTSSASITEENIQNVTIAPSIDLNLTTVAIVEVGTSPAMAVNTTMDFTDLKTGEDTTKRNIEVMSTEAEVSAKDKMASSATGSQSTELLMTPTTAARTEERLEGKFKIISGVEWDDDLADENSTAYTQLKDEVIKMLLDMYREKYGDNIRVEGVRFSSGSVDVKFELVFDDGAVGDPDAIKQLFIDSIESGSLGNFTLDKDFGGIESVTTVNPSRGTTSQGDGKATTASFLSTARVQSPTTVPDSSADSENRTVTPTTVEKLSTAAGETSVVGETTNHSNIPVSTAVDMSTKEITTASQSTSANISNTEQTETSSVSPSVRTTDTLKMSSESVNATQPMDITTMPPHSTTSTETVVTTQMAASTAFPFTTSIASSSAAVKSSSRTVSDTTLASETSESVQTSESASTAIVQRQTTVTKTPSMNISSSQFPSTNEQETTIASVSSMSYEASSDADSTIGTTGSVQSSTPASTPVGKATTITFKPSTEQVVTSSTLLSTTDTPDKLTSKEISMSTGPQTAIAPGSTRPTTLSKQNVTDEMSASSPNLENVTQEPVPRPDPVVQKYDFPDWAIGLIIAAGILLVFFMLCCIIVCCVKSKKKEMMYTINHTGEPSAYSESNKDSPSIYSASGRQYYMSSPYSHPPTEKENLVASNSGNSTSPPKGTINGGLQAEGGAAGMNGGITLSSDPPAEKEHKMNMSPPPHYTPETQSKDSPRSVGDSQSGNSLPPPPPELLVNTPEMIGKHEHIPLSVIPTQDVESPPTADNTDHHVVTVEPDPEPEPRSPQADNCVNEVNVNDVYIVDEKKKTPQPLDVRQVASEEHPNVEKLQPRDSFGSFVITHDDNSKTLYDEMMDAWYTHM